MNETWSNINLKTDPHPISTPNFVWLGENMILVNGIKINVTVDEDSDTVHGILEYDLLALER